MTQHRIPVFKLKLAPGGSISLPVTHESDPKQLPALAFHKLIGSASREHFAIMMFAGSGAPIGMSIIGVGGMTSVMIAPGEIFKVALLANCCAIICSHNHPSNSTEPSSADMIGTGRLVRAGSLLGIRVVDHVIVSPSGGFSSFFELGLMDEREREARAAALKAKETGGP